MNEDKRRRAHFRVTENGVAAAGQGRLTAHALGKGPDPSPMPDKFAAAHE